MYYMSTRWHQSLMLEVITISFFSQDGSPQLYADGQLSINKLLGRLIMLSLLYWFLARRPPDKGEFRGRRYKTITKVLYKLTQPETYNAYKQTSW